MRKILSLLMMVLLAGFVMAGSYTISFKDCGKSSDSSSGMTSTTVSDYLAAGAEYVSEVAPSGKVYLAAEGYGLKFGNSSNGGSLTLTLATAIKPTSIVVNASQYGASEGTGLFQGQSFDLTGGGGKYSFNDYTVEYDGNTEVSTISVGMQKRGYVTSITVNYASEGGEGGEGGEEATVNYYIIGTMTNWQVSEDYKLAANPDNEAEYMFTELALTTASQFKVVAVAGEDQTWYPDGQDNNYGQNGEIAADGSYDVYFRPDGQGGADWFYNCMYVAAHPEPQVDPVYGISGAWNNFDKQLFEVAADGETATFAVDLEAGEYEFKIRVDDDWLTKANNGQPYGLHREWNTIAVTDHADENLKLTADVNGVYVFTWTFASSEIAITFPVVHEMNAMWKVTEETAVAAEIEYINNYALAVTNPFATTLKPNVRTFEGYSFTHAIQVRNAAYPSADAPAGTEQSGSTSLVITAKEDVEVAFFYNRQTTDNTTGAAALNDNKDMKVFDQAAPTTALEGAFKVVWMQEDMKYVNAIKTMNLVKGHTYTVSAKGTTIQLHGIRYITDADEPEPAQPKFYITGESLVESWEPNARPSYENTYVFENLAAGEYVFKITVDGTWQTAKGFTDLTAQTPGVLPAETDDNIYFQLAEAGDVTITYDAENFTVTGNFYVAPVQLPTVAVAGSMNEWSADANVMTAAEDGLTATATIALEVGNYDFKMVVGGHWLGKDATYDITRENPNAAGIDQEIAFGPNLVLHADTEGDYTFVWFFENDSLAVTYPEYVEPDPTVVVYGSMTQPAWEVAIPFELAQDKQSATLFNDNIKVGSYTFKVQVNGEWRSNGATFNRENAAAANITGNDHADMTFVADQEGEYTFVWFFENDSLAITYPEYIEPATPKFYVTGNDALVGEELAWHADAIPSVNDTLELDLEAGVTYLLKVTLNGTWQGENNVKGYNELTEKPEQLSDVSNDHNIGFQLAEAGKVQVVYIAAAEGQAEVFKLMGNFYQSETPVEHTYTVAGNSIAAFGAEWSPKALDNDMVLQEDGTYKWEKEGIELPAGHVDFKVCEDHDWTVSYPASNYVLNIAEVGTYTITITFNPAAATEKVAAEAVKTGSAEVDPTAAVKGGWDNWAEETAFQLAEDKLSASAALNLEAGEYTFKMILNGGDWRSNGYTYHREYNACVGITGNASDMVLQADVAGQYVITWTFANDSINIAFPELPVEFTCNWDEIAWLDGSNDQIKVCKESEAVGVVNVQKPGWAAENGIYMTFPSAAWGEISLEEGTYVTEGAGLLVYLSALTQEYNEISIVCENVEYIINVYNAANAPQPAQPEYFLVGTMNNWQAAEAYKFGKDVTCADGEFVLHADLAEGDEIKVIGVLEEETTWYPAVGDNYTVDAAHAGEAKAIYFRPAGNQDWTAFGGHIWIGENQPEVNPIVETYFATDGDWKADAQSTATWDAEAQKVTVNIALDKVAQWQAQVKYQALASQPDKFYHFAVKMKANHNVNGVTVKWDDNTGLVLENASINLVENTEYVMDIERVASNAAGNGLIIFDFGFAKATDIIEIYDIVVEEVAAPELNLADGYYIIGLNGWSIYDLTAEDLFVANAEAEGEYMITKTLAMGQEFKVVSVADNALGTWYPAQNYLVDAAHAGEKDIYFRPNGGGGDGWYLSTIYIAASEVPVNPWEAWFASPGTWETETQSYLEYDFDTEKATVHINVDKDGQWRAQAKYHGPAAEAGKCYRVALKMKANNAISNVTVKYQDNVEMIYVNDIALGANVEYVFDQTAAGIAGGNGIMVLDFGYAHAGDIIEIYDVVIEEAECPANRLEDGYYLIGLDMADWTVDYLTADYLFTVNPEDAAEYMLNVTLVAGQELKVVGVANDAIGPWYPDGMDNNYIVDANHAGATTVYFRPNAGGGDDWYYGMIYVAPVDHTAIDTIDANAPAVKIIRNGQILIIKGQKMYNVMGQTIQ